MDMLYSAKEVFVFHNLPIGEKKIVENVSSSLFDDDYLSLVYLLFIYIVRTCTKSGALCT